MVTVVSPFTATFLSHPLTLTSSLRHFARLKHCHGTSVLSCIATSSSFWKKLRQGILGIWIKGQCCFSSLVMTADMVEANLGQRVPKPIWDAPQLGAKQYKSPAVPDMKYTWLSVLLNWRQVFLSLQQLSNKYPFLLLDIHGHGCPHRHINPHDKQTLLNHCSLSVHPYLSSWGAACTAEQRVVSLSSKPPSPPSFTGGGKNFKGWQRKWKGTLFIRPWRETYLGSASALNQPALLDMLNCRVAEQDRLEEYREGENGDRNTGRYC